MRDDAINRNFLIHRTWRKLKLCIQNTNVLEIKTSILILLSFFVFFLIDPILL